MASDLYRKCPACEGNGEEPTAACFGWDVAQHGYRIYGVRARDAVLAELGIDDHPQPPTLVD